MRRKQVICLCLLLVMLPALTPRAYALLAPYRGYTYNIWGDSVPAPAGYIPEGTVYIQDYGFEPLNAPQDLFVYEDKLYIVDTGNDRIVVLDSGFKPLEVMSEWTDAAGKVYTLSGPEGIFIRDGELFIADTLNKRVLRAGLDGRLIAEYGKPRGDVIPSGFDYRPSKIVADRSGYIYIMATGVWQGLITLDSDGEFSGYFGANSVNMTLSMLATQIWKRLGTKEQREAMVRFVPIEIANITIDSEDFIFTVTKGSSDAYSQPVDKIQMLNPTGNNILRYNEEDFNNSDGAIYAKNRYADVEFDYYRTRMMDSILIDIHADENGMFAALDRERGRVFIYDRESNPLFIFGGIGEQTGTFSIPSALEKLGGRYIVADEIKNCLTVFAPTEYAVLVTEAAMLYNEGLFHEALPLWDRALTINSNLTLAYRNIGRAYLQDENYREALEYLKLGEDRAGYSMAYREYRKEFVQNNLLWIVLIAAACIFVLGRLLKLILRSLGVTREKRSITFK